MDSRIEGSSISHTLSRTLSRLNISGLESMASSSANTSAKIQYVAEDPEGSEGAFHSSRNHDGYEKKIKDRSSSTVDLEPGSEDGNNQVRLFQQDEESQFDVSVLRVIVSGISKALSGNGIVTSPSRGFDWLGRVIVKPGPLEGPYYRKHRTYKIQGQLLASGHVLPWRIGKNWRYSELHSLLVEELDILVRKFSLLPHYQELLTFFPPKNWQTRNSFETAEFRGAALEAYVTRGIEITSTLLDSVSIETTLTRKQREKAKKRKRRRRRQLQLQRELGGDVSQNNDDGSVSAIASRGSENFSDSDESEYKCVEDLEEELRQIMDIFVTKLLGLNPKIANDLKEISRDLGKLISAKPLAHSRVSKDFRVDPPQAL